MSAFGTFPTTRPPRGLVNTCGALPHTPRSPRGRGAGENLLHPYHRALGRLQPVKAKGRYAVASQALTGFQPVRFG